MHSKASVQDWEPSLYDDMAALHAQPDFGDLSEEDEADEKEMMLMSRR